MTSNAAVLYRSESSACQTGTGFGTRERKRLDRAREKGYLDARCRDHQKIVEAFGLWCWRLKVPMVWLERQSPRSKYGNVRLELFTTANRLTASGQEAMQTICNSLIKKGQADVSPHAVGCKRVPLNRLEQAAKAVFRAATRAGNYEFENLCAGQRKDPSAQLAASA